MIFRNLDSDGDWQFGRGKQNYLTENYAIMKNIETTLKWFYSECFFAPDAGIPWFSLLGQKNSDIVILALKTAIMACYGVTKVSDLIFNLSENREATITFYIDTIYSQGASGSFVL
jgi:hypothetical protein